MSFMLIVFMLIDLMTSVVVMTGVMMTVVMLSVVAPPKQHPRLKVKLCRVKIAILQFFSL
jgi:hypothetical protein